MRTILLFIIITSFAACAGNINKTSADKRQQAIKEIEAAERDFQKMSEEKGIMEAFSYYAADDAVIKRENDSLVKGKNGIRNYYAAPFYKQASVTWSPDFTDASEQGDMGYTYGKYLWRAKDSSGKVTEFKGVFHTVWKRQPDGAWKFVWD